MLLYSEAANSVLELAACLFKDNSVFAGLRLRCTLNEFEITVFHAAYERGVCSHFDSLSQAGNSLCSSIFQKTGIRVHINYWDCALLMGY